MLSAIQKIRIRSFGVFRLICSAVFLFCVWGFLEIAEDYPEGRYRVFDEQVLRAFRTKENLAIPRGPEWLPEAMRDVSALGSGAVLTIVVVGVAAYFALLRQWRRTMLVIVACAGGELLNIALKALAARPRPEVVPHLAEVSSSSFPSGHSMLSAIVYLTVGAMLAQIVPGRKTAFYTMSFATLLTVMIGCTRVYLGVHYPSDVIAGWAAGTAWALLCAAIQLAFHITSRPTADASSRS